MAAVPVVINGVMMPKGKAAGDKPVPAVFVGVITIAGLTPEHPIVIPPTGPVDPPIDPPPDEGPQVAVVLKPAPETGGWGYSNKGWFFSPGASGAGPKR
jgi:hypothetical protein